MRKRRDDKRDGFERSSCAALSEGEKREIEDAVERCGRYLKAELIPITALGYGSAALDAVDYNFRILCRWADLLDGTFQSRNARREQRRHLIRLEARKIAIETGSDAEEVVADFENLMAEYVLEGIV